MLRAPPMKRRSPAIIALALTLGVGGIAYRDAGRTMAKGQQKGASSSEEKAETVPEAPEEEESPVDLEATSPVAPVPAPAFGASRFHLLPDGKPVPPLPEGAPKRVKLGIAIFRYKGAQAPPESNRSREDALALAKKALAAGQKEFIEAVKLGDLGSNENIGWIGRGILEKSVEYSVFTTDKGTLAGEVIDTPRGYWVVKRIR